MIEMTEINGLWVSYSTVHKTLAKFVADTLDTFRIVFFQEIEYKIIFDPLFENEFERDLINNL